MADAEPTGATPRCATIVSRFAAAASRERHQPPRLSTKRGWIELCMWLEKEGGTGWRMARRPSRSERKWSAGAMSISS